MYADTITLFNRYDAGGVDLWHPTILHNVDLNIDKAAIIAKYGENSTDNASLHVKINAGVIAGKTYLPPKQYAALSEAQASAHITFTPGQQFDFFIVGEWQDPSPIADEDYLDGFYNFANVTYDYCFAITSVAQYSVIPHFEILGR